MKHILPQLTLAASIAAACSASAADAIDYPDGYRHWTHIKTMVLHEGHPLQTPFMGIHHVYGNPPAASGTQTGRFAEGAILVFDLLQYDTADNASTEGERVLLGVMVKDGQRYPSTGGWGFEAFAGDSRTTRLVDDGGEGCFDCHAAQQQHDYVFSRWRD